MVATGRWTVLGIKTTDLFGVNCGQQGPIKAYALARGLVEFIRFRFGFYGCRTSLQYWACRSQSGARASSSVHDLLDSVQEGAEQWAFVGCRCCHDHVDLCATGCASRAPLQAVLQAIRTRPLLFQDQICGWCWVL